MLQKPLVMAGLFLVMIIALAVLIRSYPGGESPLPPEKIQVRSGTQVAKITILPKENADSMEVDVEQPASESKVADSSLPAAPPLRFRIDRFQKLATQPLKFQIFDVSGNELTPDYLETLQGAKVHFFLAHASLKLFQHILADYRGGVWNASAFMPLTGTYYAYVLIDPLKGDPVMHRYDLVVRAESPEDIGRADPTLTDSDDASPSYTAVMEMKRFDDYRGFLYEVKRSGNPIVITPSNDALGTMTLFRHGDPDFLKTFTADAASEERLGKISFSTSLLQAGRYTAFMEVKVDGRTRTFAHTFDIGT